MAAITFTDLSVLPRVADLEPTARIRQVARLSSAPQGYEGEGFPVRRAFAGVDARLLDPFIMMDQMGEVDYAAGEPRGTSWHPHRGFETVTYLIEGEFLHQDSHGGGGHIRPGDTQWMTAGSGLLHIETPPEELVRSGGLFHGLQLWVNLPQSAKTTAPKYQDLRGDQVALASSADGGALLRIVAGDIAGVSGPGSTYTPMAMVHASVSAAARLELSWPQDYNALAYVLAGSGTVGPTATAIGEGQLAVFGPGDAMTLAADVKQSSRSASLEIVLLGGLPLREPIAWAGPFVMNTKAEVLAAFEDYQSGRFGAIPPDGIQPFYL